MKLAYVDTSCVAAVVFAEPGHRDVITELNRFEELYSSNLLEAEIRAALRRERVTDDLAMLQNISWVLPDRRVTREITTVLDAGYVRGADLWHLACALYLSPDPRELSFLTMDRAQAEVASALGFAVLL